MARQEMFQRVDATDALEIALRNTRYETLEELDRAMKQEVIAWLRRLFPQDDIKDFSRLRGTLSDYHAALVSIPYRSD